MPSFVHVSHHHHHLSFVILGSRWPREGRIKWKGRKKKSKLLAASCVFAPAHIYSCFCPFAYDLCVSMHVCLHVHADAFLSMCVCCVLLCSLRPSCDWVKWLCVCMCMHMCACLWRGKSRGCQKFPCTCVIFCFVQLLLSGLYINALWMHYAHIIMIAGLKLYRQTKS